MALQPQPVRAQNKRKCYIVGLGTTKVFDLNFDTIYRLMRNSNYRFSVRETGQKTMGLPRDDRGGCEQGSG